MARPEAALITGVFGSGKSTVLAEAADLLEVGGLPFAAIDVDWLGWAVTAADATAAGAESAADAGRAGPHHAERTGEADGVPDDGSDEPPDAGAAEGPHLAFGQLTLENLGLVVSNDRRHGIEHFLLAHAVWRREEMAELRSALAMPLRVIGLVVPLPVIQARLASDPTRARLDDLARLEAWLGRSREGIDVDLQLDGTRPVAESARAIVDWLGWLG